MPEITSFPHASPCWFDVTSPDQQASASFYGALFGWTYQPPPEPSENTYGIFQLGGKHVAGIYDAEPPMPPAWSVYINVDDVAAVTEKVKSAGGTVMVGPVPAQDMGQMAICADPGGAIFGLWQPTGFAGAEIGRERGSVTWVELNTRDKQACADFYGEVLGWQAHGGGPGGYTMFRNGDAEVAGMLDMDAVGVPAEAPTYWAVYIGVADVDATATQCTELGGSIIVPPMDVPGSRMAVLADPAGAVFTVNQTG